MIQCLIDNSSHGTLEELHKHLRKLKVRQEDYYVQYVVRKDLYTGESIPFKNVEQYLAAEFINKENLKNWIISNPEEGKKWAINWLEKRKKEKLLEYPPCQVELKSLLCPSIHYYNRNGGYNDICRNLGYKIRFDGKFEKGKIPVKELIVDTREQVTLKFPIPTEKSKLNCGDYGLKNGDVGVYIERKSMNDFISTLSDRQVRGFDSNFDRFGRELTRADECGAYIVMIVEGTIETALSFNEFAAFGRVKVTPAHIFKNLRDLLHKHNNFQVLFVHHSQEAAEQIINILSAGESVKTVDLQYLFETGNL